MLLSINKVFDKNEIFISRNDLPHMRKQKNKNQIKKQVISLSV